MQALVYLALIACLFASGFADDDAQVECVNKFMDGIFNGGNKDVDKIEPMDLDVLGKEFEREGVFGKVTGEAKLKDGRLHGLSTMKRKGDAVVIDLDESLIIVCRMTFKKINATYKGVLLINDLGPKISVTAKVGNSDVSLMLMVPPEGGNSTLLSFTINKLQDIRISVSGLGPWGWTASIFSTLVLNALEKPVAKTASLKLFDYVSRQFEKVPYSACV